MFSRQLAGGPRAVCYVAGMCSPAKVPHRLYTADFTTGQKYTFCSMRFVGVFGIVASLGISLLVGVKCHPYFRSLYRQRPSRFILSCLVFVLVGILVLGYCGLTYIGPFIGRVFGSNEYPVDCQTLPPPDEECMGYSTYDGYVSNYTLETGTSVWKFERVLFQGPALTFCSLVLIVMVWVGIKKIIPDR
jgi:hypothetical protein